MWLLLHRLDLTLCSLLFDGPPALLAPLFPCLVFCNSAVLRGIRFRDFEFAC